LYRENCTGFAVLAGAVRGESVPEPGAELLFET
jgi:hypothetical protein